jgi:hypothetical protein
MDVSCTESIAAIASAIAAVTSVIVASIAVLTQRTQSQLSVKPLPWVALNDYVACVSVVFRNVGVGPLVIKDLTVTDVNTRVQRGNVIDFMPTLPDGIDWETFVGTELIGRPVAANGEIVLLRFSEDPTLNPAAALQYTKIRNALSALEIRVVIKDVYGNETTYERRFTWFSRTLNGSLLITHAPRK